MRAPAKDGLVSRPLYQVLLILLPDGDALLCRRHKDRSTVSKGLPMKLPQNTNAYVWGAVLGAIALAVVGFGWGGWVTGGTATKNAAAASEAKVAVLAPICADRFRAQGDSALKIAELAKASSWDRGKFVEKSGFAMMPGSTTTDSDVARACAEILANPTTPKT